MGILYTALAFTNIHKPQSPYQHRIRYIYILRRERREISTTNQSVPSPNHMTVT